MTIYLFIFLNDTKGVIALHVYVYELGTEFGSPFHCAFQRSEVISSEFNQNKI